MTAGGSRNLLAFWPPVRFAISNNFAYNGSDRRRSPRHALLPTCIAVPTMSADVLGIESDRLVDRLNEICSAHDSLSIAISWANQRAAHSTNRKDVPLEGRRFS